MLCSGTCRVRIMLDARRAVGVVASFQHLGKVHAAWRHIGQDMPFALALGVEPVATYAAGMPLPEHGLKRPTQCPGLVIRTGFPSGLAFVIAVVQGVTKLFPGSSLGHSVLIPAYHADSVAGR